MTDRAAPRFDKARATLMLLGACVVAAALTAVQASTAAQDGAGPWSGAQHERPHERAGGGR